MRTIIDLPDEHIKALDYLGKRRNKSRAALVRDAISRFIAGEDAETKSDVERYFGLLKDEPGAFGDMDGLAWQKKIRAEWDDRDAALDARLGKMPYGVHDRPQEPFKPRDNK